MIPGTYLPAAAARSISAMMIFFISNIARMAAAAVFRSSPDISSMSRVGATCHDNPYRSVSQPELR